VLSAEEVKPLLLYEDCPVRDLAVDYFRDGWSQDPTLVPMILEACRRYGVSENVHGLIACGQLVVTDAALDSVLQMLAETKDTEMAWRLHRIISHAPVDVLLRKESAVLDVANLPDEVLKRFNRRKDLSGWPAAKLWQELQDFAERSRDQHYVGEIDHAYADDLIEALGPHDEPDAATICNMLQSFGDDGGWLETFLVDLVGERRLRTAIPLLIDRLRVDTDYLRERVTEAIVKIGDPEAARLIHTIFPTEPWHVKNYASGAMGKIRHPAAEEAILELLEIEEDPGIRTMLCLELCEMFSQRGVEVVRRQIRSDYDRTIVCLEDHLLPVAHVLGIELPEADVWRAEREEKERRQAERRAELDEMGRRYQALKARGIDPFAKLAEKPRPPSRVQPLPAAVEPVRLDRPKVGRNDPCPCGSGKKFKKCCARKSDYADDLDVSGGSGGGRFAGR
jgi:hypothetical protein